MAKVFNRARMSTATTGTGTITLGSAISSFATFAEAGVANGDVVSYCIQEGADFEVGRGTYTSSGTTLSRDTVLLSKIGGTAGTSKMNLAGAAQVFISALAEDFTQGKQTCWIPATAMIARTTNGAASGTVETTTNRVMLKTLDFDTSTQEFAQFSIRMPKSWNLGTVSFQAVWSHASTTTNFGVAWALQAFAFSDDDAADQAFGTEQVVTDTGGTTNDFYITSESAAITIGGTPATGDLVVFQVKRVPADAADNIAIDARLHGINVFYTTNASTDV